MNDQTSPNLAAERAALHARLEGVVAAEEAFNVPEALTYWAEDGIVQPAGSPQIEGKDAIRKLYSQYFESGLVREFSGSYSHVEMSAGGDLAYAYGVNRMVLAGEDGFLLDVCKYLAIWKKIYGYLMSVSLSFSSDASEPSPISG